jgi:hypothetical protein
MVIQLRTTGQDAASSLHLLQTQGDALAFLIPWKVNRGTDRAGNKAIGSGRRSA